MKVLLINGSPNAAGCTYTALEEITRTLDQEGVESEIQQIGKKIVRPCIACFHCKKTGSNHCVFDDDIANRVIDKINESDALVVGSPVYYASMSGQVKSLLDRVFFAGGGGFQNKLAASVVSCRRGGAIGAFDHLNHYFTISHMHVVSSQYWNQVHGHTPDDVRQDLEGLQMMRSLGKNMAWLLKCIEAGDQNGVKRPEYEPKVATNFIR